MANCLNKRILNELKEFQKDPPPNCQATIVNDNMYHWSAIIFGPSGTPYENGVFALDIYIPAEYPFKPPKVTFKTPIIHPNIKDGSICLDILKSAWSPSLTIAKVLLSICSLLSEPNPSSALNGELARLYRTDRDAYNEAIRNHTLQNSK